MRAVASRWGGGCPGHRTPRPGGSPSPPPVCAGADRARGGGPGAESRDRAGRLVERAAISSGSRSGSPAGRRLAVSASASRRVTPTPPSAECTKRSRGGMTTRRRSLLPGHRAAPVTALPVAVVSKPPCGKRQSWKVHDTHVYSSRKLPRVPELQQGERHGCAFSHGAELTERTRRRWAR